MKFVTITGRYEDLDKVGRQITLNLDHVVLFVSDGATAVAVMVNGHDIHFDSPETIAQMNAAIEERNLEEGIMPVSLEEFESQPEA